MLRKITFVAALFSFTIALPCAVLAQDATSTATRKDKVKEKVETRKEKVAQKMDAMKEGMATREAALKAKLATFRDKKKADVAERVNTNLNRINVKQTEQMLKHLNKMSALLDKLEARVNSGSPDIKDETDTRAAITESRAKIASSTAAVQAQAAKDYTLTVASESKVKAGAQTQREKLHTDLKSVRQQVIEAKQSVSNAIRVAKGLGKEATSSGQ